MADVVTMPGGEPSRIDVDRTPPQDVVAEQCVLGAMLLSKDAIADVVEVLKPGDFYRPAHQTVYDTVLDLYGRGEPADPVTIAAELTRDGTLAKVGGAPYLHTLIASVPTAANAAYYAEIVRERAILRRLVEAGTKIVQLGYGAASGMGGEVDDVVGADGRPTRVVAATDVMTDRPCYRVCFSDGTVIVADAKHQWLTDTRASRRATGPAAGPAIRTTEEIARTLHCPTADRRRN